MSYTAPPNGFRTFLILWLSQSVSVVGSSLTMFAINIWLVQVVFPRPEQQSDLAWALAAIGLAFGVTGLVVMPFAGALADRLDRRRLKFWADVARAALITGTAILMATGALRFWMVLPIIVVATVFTVLHESAFDASYAMLVPEKHLPRANGMMQSLWALSSIISPGLAAFLISMPALARQGALPGTVSGLLAPLQNGSALALGLDGISFLLSAAVLLFLQIPSPLAAGQERPRLREDIQIGALYVWRRRPLVWLLGTYAVFNLLLPLGVFLPLIVKQGLAPDWSSRGYTYETALALINTMGAAGGLAGGALISLWGGFRSRRVLVVLVSVLSGSLVQILFGLTPSFYIAAGAVFVLHMGFPIGNAHSQAVWQAQVPRELQGRVFAVRRVIGGSMGPLGQVLAGALAGAMSPGAGLALLGAITAVFCTIQIFNPMLMRVEDKEYLDRMAALASEG